MEKNILLIVNPKAGSMDKSELIDTVSRIVEQRGYQLSIYETTGNDDKEEIKRRIKEREPWRILIAGGDGTINLVASILGDFDTTLGILPAGSANGLASNLHIPDELEQQIRIALGDKTYKIDHLNVNGETCLHISDLGLNAELIKNFEDSPIRGKFGYFLQSIPTLIDSKSPFTFNIEINGEKMVKTGILLAIANAKQYGTGANINPNGKMDDGKFEVLIFTSFDIPEIINTLYDKVDLESGFAECFTTDHVIITSDNPIPFQIDGEPKGDVNKVEGSIYPQKLQIAVP
ncbi:lipid kinase, YegS/Rv2252/BmrU family [Flavobacteriaceae bacterium MAR_2010_188]|nr:lipid kinase, YegS/Rv2252/BmrU family [Flavobacteriaceae bacterium MAR_2010_188]